MSKNRYKLIVFEGIDGTGKTTLAKMLAKKIKAAYYKTPPKEIWSIRKSVDRSDPAVRLAFYKLGNAIGEQFFKNTLKTQHVVCDRYVYSTNAYQSVASKRELNIRANFAPDYVVYTKADWKKVVARLKEKKNPHPTEKIPFLRQVLKKYPKYLPKKNLIEIDTTHENEHQSLARIRNAIQL
jgi:dTMP kinase